jgi:hypothetical protein
LKTFINAQRGVNKIKTKVFIIIDMQRFFYYIGWLSFFMLVIYIFMKIVKFIFQGFTLEVGLAEWMMLGYICAIIPIATLFIIIPKTAIIMENLRLKFIKANEPLVFAYDLQDNSEEIS